MQTPDPLPQPGAWLVTAAGSMYEIRHCAGEHGPCTVPPADAEGVFYWSVDEGERIWTPWNDVYAVGTYESVDAIAAIVGAYAIGAPAPRPIAHVTRWDVTIYHAPGNPPPDALRLAVADIIRATLRAAGIDDAAVMIDPERTE